MTTNHLNFKTNKTSKFVKTIFLTFLGAALLSVNHAQAAGEFGITWEGMVGDTVKKPTLKEAISYCTGDGRSNATITVLKDYTATTTGGEITWPANASDGYQCTLDLNGHTITDPYALYLINLNSATPNAVFTITDKTSTKLGKMSCTRTSAESKTVQVSGGTLIVEAGTIEGINGANTTKAIHVQGTDANIPHCIVRGTAKLYAEGDGTSASGGVFIHTSGILDVYGSPEIEAKNTGTGAAKARAIWAQQNTDDDDHVDKIKVNIDGGTIKSNQVMFNLSGPCIVTVTGGYFTQTTLMNWAYRTRTQLIFKGGYYSSDNLGVGTYATPYGYKKVTTFESDDALKSLYTCRVIPNDGCEAKVATSKYASTYYYFPLLKQAFEFAQTNSSAITYLLRNVTYTGDSYLDYNPATAISNTLDLGTSTITATNTNDRFLNISKGTFEITGTGGISFTRELNDPIYALYVNPGARLNISGGNISCTNTKASSNGAANGCYVKGASSSLYITGSPSITATARADYNATSYAIHTNGYTTDIRDTPTFTAQKGLVAGDSNDGHTVSRDITVDIWGGTFNCTGTVISVQRAGSTIAVYGNVRIKGGKFSSTEATPFLSKSGTNASIAITAGDFNETSGTTHKDVISPLCTSGYSIRPSDISGYAWKVISGWTVTLKANGGAADGLAIADIGASALSYFSFNSTRTGYNLNGFYTASSGGTKVLNADGTYASSSVSGYITGGTWSKGQTCSLWAQWTARTYSVTLDREGGTTGSTSVTMTYGSNTHTAITAPTKSGYIFSGWYTGDNGTGTMVMDASGTLQASVSGYTNASSQWIRTTSTTLYAKWVDLVATVTTSGGTVTYYSDLQTALTYAAGQDGSTVKVMKSSVSVSTTLSCNPSSKTCTLDLNNCTVSLNTRAVDRMLSVGGTSGKLILTDSSVAKGGKLNFNALRDSTAYVVVIGGTNTILEQQGGTIYGRHSERAGKTIMGVNVNALTATFTMKGGKIDVQALGPAEGVRYYNQCTIQGTANIQAVSTVNSAYGLRAYTYSDGRYGKLTVNTTGGTPSITATGATYAYGVNDEFAECTGTISGGTFTVTANGNHAYGVDKRKGGEITVSGGTFTVDGKLSAKGVCASSGATVNVSNASFTVRNRTGGSASGIYLDGSSASTIGGSTSVTAIAKTDLAIALHCTGSSTMTVNAGTFSATDTTNQSYGVYLDASTITVNGGTITAAGATSSVNNVECMRVASGTATISGGTFNSSVGVNCSGVRVLGGTANISGGTFNVKNGIQRGAGTCNVSGGYFNASSKSVETGASGTVVLTGGYYTNNTGLASPSVTSPYHALSTSTTVGGVTYNYKVAEAYTLTWVTDGDALTGSYTPNGLVEVGTTLVKPNTPTKPNYVFAGWNNGSGVVTPSTMPAANTTYTATWTAAVASVKVGSTTTYYTSLPSALAYAKTQNNSTIKLLQNTTVTERLNYNPTTANTCTLDLNGKTVTNTNQQIMLYLDGNSSNILTITDSSTGGTLTHQLSYAGNTYVVGINQGKLILSGGTLHDENTYSDAGTVATANGVNVGTDNSSFEMTGGRIEAVKAAGNSGNQAIGVSAYAPVDISGGTIVATSAASNAFGVQCSRSGKTYTIRGTVTIQTQVATGTTHTVRVAAGTCNVTGGTFTATQTSSATSYGNVEGVRVYGGTCNISGGTFTVTNNSAGVSTAARQYASNAGLALNISGGTFTADQGVYMDGTNTATVTITGGTFINTAHNFIQQNTSLTPTISGGKFKTSGQYVYSVNEGCALPITGGYFNEYSGTIHKTQIENKTTGTKHVVDLSTTEKAAAGMSGYSYKVVDAYSVTYGTHTNGNFTIKVEDGSASSETKYAASGQTVTLAATANTGYQFASWTVTKAGGGTVTVTSNQFTMPADNVTVVATFTARTYTVTLDKNGGSANGSATATYNSNSLTSISAPTKTGYRVVDGYYTNAACTTKVATAAGALQASTTYTNSSSKWTSTSNQTLYAKWTANTYTVAFNANGGSGSMSNQGFTYGTAQNLTSNAFTRTNYEFAGWNTQADGNGTNYTNGQSVNNLTATHNGTVTLYAKWTAAVASVTIGGATTYHATIGGAFTKANSAASAPTITLLANCSSAAVLTFAPTNAVSGTLNLNGKTLSGTVDKVLTINKSGQTFTITDSSNGQLVNTVSSVNDSCHAVWVTAGTLAVNKGVVKMNNTNASGNAQARAIYVKAGATATISGSASIQAISEQKAYGIKTEGTTATTTTVTVSGGSISAETSSGATAYGVWMRNTAFTMSAGTITATAYTSTARGVYIEGTAAKATMRLTGGTITATTNTANSAYGIHLNWAISGDNPGLTIPTGSTVSVTATAQTTAAYTIYTSWATSTIQAGTFKAETKTGNSAVGFYGDYHNSTTISGGTWTVISGAKWAWGAQANRGTINISGGTFNVSGSSEIAGVYAYATTTTSTTDNTYNSIINIRDSPVFTVEATSSAWGVFANHNGSGTSVGHAGTVNVSGGTFNVTSTSAKGIYVAAAGSYASGNSTPKANISGGKFNVSGSSAVATSTTAANTAEVITGGYYSVNGGLSNYTHPTKDCNYRVFTISPALESKYNYKVAQFYTIAYNKGANGTGTEYTDYKAHGDNITLRGEIFSRTGYTQTGWSTSDGGSKAYELSATYSSNAALTLYPTWTAKTTTVTLNANTANHGSGANQSVTATYGSALPSFTATTAATGYHLVGYYTAATDGTKVINADGTFAANSGIWNRTDGATLTLYAHYEANTYTITFNANGGTLNTTSVTATYNSSTLAAITNPSWTGFTFTGWWTNTSSGTLVINTSGALQANVSGYTGAGGIWTATEGKTLYAQWTPNPYSITLDKNNSDAGSASGSATAVYWNTSLGSITAPTRTGYTVEGYYKEAGCTNKIATSAGALQASTTYTDATNRWTSTSNQTLYTKWTEKSYDVTFYNGGHGTVKVAGSTVANGTTAKANHFTTKTLVAEAATGYDFNGWTKTGSVTIGNTANASTNIKATAAGGTVTATWTAHSYTISYDLAGGSVASANPANYTIESSAITLNNPTKTGYTFAGWTGTGLASATMTVTIAAGSTGNRSYTATWTPNTNTAYTVNHYQQKLDGTYPATPTNTDNLEGTTGASVTPARKSYTGFTAPSGTTVTIAADGSTVVNYNYTRNSYTLTWNANGGSISGSYTSGTVKFGATITKPADANVTRANYEFTGWNTTPAATMPAANTTYTAQWTAAVASVTPSGGSASYYSTLAKAFAAANAASANVTIKLLANCSSAAVLTFAPESAINGTLDLNNKTLSGSVDKVLTINKSGQTFTITDTNGTKKGKLENKVNSNGVIYAVWVSAGGLTINCDTIRMDNTSTGTSAQARTIHLTTNTPLTINGGSVEAISRQSAYGVYAEGATNTTNQKPLITISSGNVKATTRTAATAYGVWMDRARFILNSGSVTATAQTNTAYAVYNKGGQITLNGGTLTAETLTEGSAFGVGTGWVSSNSMIFSVHSTSTVTVNATAKTTGAYALNLNYSDNTIQGGTFNATTLEGTNARGISSSTHFIRISGSPVFNVEAGRDLAVGNASKSLAYGIVCSRTGYYDSGTGAEVIDSVYITGTPVFNVQTDSIAYGILASASVSKTAVPTESYNTHFNISGGTYNVTARKTAYGVQAHRNGVKDVADKAPVATQGHVVVYDGEFIVSAAGALGICTSRPATYTDSNGSATGTPTITVKGGKFKVSGSSAKAAYSHADVNGITQQILGGYYSINTQLANSVVSPKKVLALRETHALYPAPYGYRYTVAQGGTVTWKNYDNSTLQTKDFISGETPSYTGSTPTKPTDASYTYTHSGWTPSITTMANANQTYTATFSQTERKYSVTVAAGANGSVSPTSVSNIGCTTASGDITATANTGYHFTSWTLPSGVTAAAGYTTSSNPIRINATASGKTITANFAANTYQVRFNGNGNTGGSMSNESFTYDAAAKALTANAFTKTNYHFIGWATSAGGDVVYADGASVRNLTATNNGIVDLYAKWAIDTYTVTITKNEDSYGTISGTSIAGVPHGTAISTSTNKLTINGTTITATAAATTAQYSYAFSNWTKGDGSALPATVTGAITVRANFTRTARTYTVTLNTNGGTINAGNVTSYTYGTGATLPTNVTKTGYTFAGWYDNSELTGSAVTTITTSATGNKTYWAKWTAATLRFTKAGGGNWNVASNWTPACVPTAAHDVNIETPCTVTSTDAVAKSVVIDKSSSKTGQLVIAAGQALNVTESIQLKNASGELVATTPSDLVILSSEAANNASLVFSNSTTSGNQATVYMYSKAEGYDSHWYWQYVGTPFVGTLANPNYAGSWLYRWKDDCTGWEAVYNENTIDQWTGYCLTQPAETTLEMEGRLLPTTELVNLNFPEGALNGTPKVFANSWTAPIQITQMEASDFTNVVATIYLFNTGNNKDKVYATGSAPGTYISIPINAAGTDGLPDKISSMQGFYVQKLGTEPSATVTLDYSKHVRPSGVNTIVNGPMYAPKRSGFEPEWMKVAVQGSRYGANIYLFAREDFSRGFDNGWDGENLNSAGAAPLLYSAREDGTKDAISAIPEFEGAVVAFQAGEDSEYTFSFKYNGDDLWYLNDLQTQTSTRISVNNTYTFRTSDNDEQRFIISATPLAKVIEGTESIQDSAVSVQKQLIKDKLYIKVHTRTYDATGKLVESK